MLEVFENGGDVRRNVPREGGDALDSRAKGGVRDDLVQEDGESWKF